MNRIIDRRVIDYFELAAKAAIAKNDLRTYLIGSVGIRADGAIVTAANSSVKEPDAKSHSESRLSRKLDYGATVYVARVRTNGSFGMAKPCINCRRVLKSKGVRFVYYTVNSNEYDILDLTDRVQYKEKYVCMK